MNTKYTLQLRHSEVYSTREDVINEIDVDLRRKHTQILPYEPILFYYGKDGDINTILLVGLPEGVTKDGKSYFIIDTAELQEEIDAAGSESAAIAEKLENEIAERKAAIEAEAKTREEADAAETTARKEADEAEAKTREEADAAETTARKEADEAEAKTREEADAAETTARKEADEAEAKTREEADAAETTARKEADEAEAKTREEADAAETTARKEADEAEAKTREEADAAETAARKEADEAEAKAREDADVAETAARKEADEAETKAREDADAAETAAREAKDNELETSIATEKSERVAKDKELDDSIKYNVDDLKSIIKACGLIYNEKLSTDRVSYTPDLHDEIIRDAKTVSEAVACISTFVAKIGKNLQIAVESTDTVSLYKFDNEKDGGSIISAEVNLAGTDGLSRKNYDNNIIGKTSDGLYASASIEPSTTNPNILVFKTSGYIDGQFKVDAYETEVPLTAYKGDDGKKSGIEVEVDPTKNLISAKLNLASDKTNLLKLEDGEYIVEGMAKNIKYKDTTVAQALNTQSNRLDEIEDTIDFVKAIDIKGDETDTTSVTVEKSVKGDFTITSDVNLSSDNSIIVSKGGLAANVSATYKKGTSTLVIEVGKNSYSIDLSDLAVSVLKSASYDSVTEEIVLTFIVGDSEKTVRVPVGTLIHDIEVDDTDTIDLTLKSVSGGPNHISAELRVDKSHSDNILTVTSNGAYVSKSYITDAVKEEATARKEGDAELKKSIEKVSELANQNKENIAEEIKNARAAEKENATAIAQEIKDARAAENANADAIATNAAAIKANETSISEEASRAQKAEKANADAITAEATRAEAAEVKNANAIASEIDRATEKEQDLLEKIGDNTTKIGENKAAIAQEVKDARAAEKANAESIAAEATRATKAEAANATAIGNEELRAIAAEEKNAASISEEVKRATKAEEVLTADVATNAENIANVTSIANTNKAELANEITRAKAAEKANVDAITANTEAIAAATTKVNDIDKSVVEEITRAKKAEEANATAIATENKRAIVAEEANASSIADEIVRAKKVEEANATAIAENKTAISTLDKTLQNEVTRATDAEAANAKAISTETKRATEVEAAINEKIAKNASDIATITTSVGNIELKKEGDLAYALYVNGTKHGEFTIPQDQFLKSVNYDATKKAIVFVFNTASGEQTQEVSVADLVDTYTNGEGILLNGNAFSVDFTKVASVEVVNGEISRAKAKETELATAIDTVKTNVEDSAKRIATNETEISNLTEKLTAETDRAKAKETELTAALGSTNTNLDAVTKRVAASETNVTSLTEKLTAETNRAKEAEKKNSEAIDAEVKRAKEAETTLQTSVKANSDAVVANSTAILNETTRAKESEEQIKKLNSETSGKIDTAITEVKGLIANETTRATAAEKTNADAVVKENERALAAEKVISDNLTQEILRAKESEKEITATVATKADAASVYTKEEIVNLVEPYAKTADVQEKLDAKLNVTDAENVYATKEALQSVKDGYATTDSVTALETALGKRIDLNETSIDNFGLTYNSATSELVYTDKNGVSKTYKLYSGSLVKSGKYENGNIVLEIETAGQASQITIPVSELVSDIDAKISVNSNAIKSIEESIAKLAKSWEVTPSDTIELTKSTYGEKDSLSAKVKVASSNKQAIQSTGDGLYVSNDLEDFTVVYGADGTISAQKAISTLKETIETTKTNLEKEIATNVNNIATLKSEMTAAQENIKTLTNDVTIAKSNIGQLQNDVTSNTSAIDNVKVTVKALDNTVTQLSTRVATAEASVVNVTNRLTTIETEVKTQTQTIETYKTQIDSIKNSVDTLAKAVDDITGEGGELKSILAEINKIKTVTGYENYSATKNMSARIDALETDGGPAIKTEIDKIENELIGPKDGSVDGSVWAAVNNLVDAGTFN